MGSAIPWKYLGRSHLVSFFLSGLVEPLQGNWWPVYPSDIKAEAFSIFSVLYCFIECIWGWVSFFFIFFLKISFHLNNHLLLNFIAQMNLYLRHLPYFWYILVPSAPSLPLYMLIMVLALQIWALFYENKPCIKHTSFTIYAWKFGKITQFNIFLF